MAGDFSPLTIEATPGATRTAPPSLILAMAVGLGTVDMPVPSIVEWEWLNWRFPRPVHAGETVYARWTLTQKRPPAPGAPSSIVVWRVDVHTADGALCAEGEVGAKVRRDASAVRQASAPPAVRPQAADEPDAAPAAAGTAATRSRRRGRRRTTTSGTPPEPPPSAAPPPAAVVKPSERASQSRRRRRRRPASASGGAQRDGESPPAPAAPPQPAPAPSGAAGGAPPKGTLSRVIGRLRRGQEPRAN